MTEKITMDDFGLPEKEEEPIKFNGGDFYFSATDATGLSNTASAYQYSINRDNYSIYTIEPFNRFYWVTPITYNIEYYCPSCAAKYKFEGNIRNEAHSTICISCGATINIK